MSEPQQVAIQIGPSVEVVAEARRSILAILEAEREEETVRQALRVFEVVCRVEGVTIHDCNISMSPGTVSTAPPVVDYPA